MLLAARTRVRFLRGGEVVEHPNPYLPGGPERLEIPQVGTLEGYPNRDSLPYGSLYGIEEPEDLFRGTLRYPGWCETMEAFYKLGLLDPQAEPGIGPSYSDLLDQRLPPGSGPMPARIARFLDLPEDHPVLERFAWLGLFSQQPLPDDAHSPMDALAALFAEKLVYGEDERDMVVLQHRFGIEESDGSRREVVERLVAFGTPGDESAMARTVGLPAALAAGLILDGRVTATGVQIPVAEEIARPVLRGLRERGLEVEVEGGRGRGRGVGGAGRRTDGAGRSGDGARNSLFGADRTPRRRPRRTCPDAQMPSRTRPPAPLVSRPRPPTALPGLGLAGLLRRLCFPVEADDPARWELEDGRTSASRREEERRIQRGDPCPSREGVSRSSRRPAWRGRRARRRGGLRSGGGGR